ncbi:MAG: hypothetical protein IPH08_02590 [Rhodocyclaceae bacterium]|jgi:hypothetical protein|nr:hypothetical protein [Rhodocyclaceae bacterium]MBK6906055.1 hypothetical protein [Rhodocyclaceae bacterium]
MTQAVIDDIESFKVFLAGQPLCQWAAQKQRDLDQGKTSKSSGGSSAKAKSDNAELAAALSSMA